MKRIIAFFTFLIISAPVALMAQWRDGYGCCGFGRNFGFGGWPMIIITIVILALLVFFAIKMIKSQGNPFASQDPMSILKSRYAKGEITKEQFQEMKKDFL